MRSSKNRPIYRHTRQPGNLSTIGQANTILSYVTPNTIPPRHAVHRLRHA